MCFISFLSKCYLITDFVHTNLLNGRLLASHGMQNQLSTWQTKQEFGEAWVADTLYINIRSGVGRGDCWWLLIQERQLVAYGEVQTNSVIVFCCLSQSQAARIL